MAVIDSEVRELLGNAIVIIKLLVRDLELNHDSAPSKEIAGDVKDVLGGLESLFFSIDNTNEN